MLEAMHTGDREACEAVGLALKDIEAAVHDAIACLRSGGRLWYAGAGTSGRLGVLDASEVPPTFGVDLFGAIMAGGDSAVFRSVEGAEDDEEAGHKAALGLGLKPASMVMGISASGQTPFVLGFLRAAHGLGCRCWLLLCSYAPSPGFVHGVIRIPTGPEVLAGSTRLKAGTATKMALNMLSTASMAHLGGVYDGMMVDVTPTNAKLKARAVRMISDIAGCDEAEASEALRASGMRVKVAALMIKSGLAAMDAGDRLKKAGGSLRKAFAEAGGSK
jgi:N-acetylmuramic acid 6-phosphate etherase